MLLSLILGRLFIIPADYAPAVLTDVVAWDDVVPTTSEWCEAIGYIIIDDGLLREDLLAGSTPWGLLPLLLGSNSTREDVEGMLPIPMELPVGFSNSG